ncbi:MAG: hypothetical protein ABSE22_10725 [Xanthobacteraceae bacterium]
MVSAIPREGGYGSSVPVIHNDSSQADHIIVPDAELLFTADFCRVGPDLVLTCHDGRRHVIPDYFANENRPTLVAANGASLAPDLVALRAGSPTRGAYARAQPTTQPDPIGKLEKVEGKATVIRNGNAVAINVGDAVFKGDVIETGIDGVVAMVFVDGTKFHLHASGRMVLDEFICGVEKCANSTLFRVVKGMFGFVAGKLAATGPLIVDTPVGQIRSNAPAAGFGSLAFGILTFGLIHEIKAESADIALLDNETIDYKDLKHGVYEIFTKEAHPRHIIIDDPGQTIVLRPGASGSVSVEQVANTPIQMAQLQSAYQGARDTFLRGQQDPFIQHFQLDQHANAQPTNNPGATGNNTSVSSVASTGSTGSSTPAAVLASTATAQLIPPVQNDTATTGATPIPAPAPVSDPVSNPTTTTTPTQQLVLPPVAPTVFVSKTLSLSGSENTAIKLNGVVSVSDSPNTGDTLATTLAVTNGSITVGAASGTTIGGNDSGSVTLTGTAAQINAALGSASYLGNTNFYGADNLTVTTANTTSGNSSGTQTVSITVADTTTVSESVPPTLSGSENTAISLSAITVSDSPNTGDTLTTVLSVAHGSITVGAASGTTIGGNDSGTVTLTGTAAQINAALGSASYTGNTNYYGSDSLSVQTTDGTSGSTVTKTAAISVADTTADTTAVSESVPPTLSGTENTAISLSAITVSDSPNTSDTLTTVLTVSHGTVTIGTPGGIVSNNDSGSVTLTGTAAQINAALGSASYTGNTNYYGSDSLSVQTTDGTSGSTAPSPRRRQ